MIARFFELVADLITKERFRVALFVGLIGLGAVIVSHEIETPDARPKLSSFLILRAWHCSPCHSNCGVHPLGTRVYCHGL